MLKLFRCHRIEEVEVLKTVVRDIIIVLVVENVILKKEFLLFQVSYHLLIKYRYLILYYFIKTRVKS